MIDLKTLIEELKNWPVDIRLEVVLAELFANKQLDPGIVRIDPLGIFERNHQKDFKEIEFSKSDLGQIENIIFQLWREGIFDALPNGIFYKATSRKYKKNSKEIRDELLIQQEEERAGRDFFLPIEQEFYRQRLQVERIEREVFSGFTYKKGKEIFARQFWQLDLNGIPDDQVTALLNFLPFSFLYKGSLNKVEQVFSVVLRCPIQLTNRWGRRVSCRNEQLPGLGDTYMGINLVLGQDFADGLPLGILTIGPIPATTVPEYLEKGCQARLLSILMRFFMPIDLETHIIIELREEDKMFCLDDDPHQGILAYTSYLSS